MSRVAMGIACRSHSEGRARSCQNENHREQFGNTDTPINICASAGGLGRTKSRRLVYSYSRRNAAGNVNRTITSHNKEGLITVSSFTRTGSSDFGRVRNGYDPAAVDELIGEMSYVQQGLQQEVESLRTQLDQSSAQVAELHQQLNDTSAQVVQLNHERAALTESSQAPQAMTDRIAKMLRVAVDEVSEMQYEARLEAESMIANAQAEAETARTQARQNLAELAARQRAMETEYAEVMSRARDEAARIIAQAVSESERMREVEALRRQQAEEELTAELSRLRRETEARVEEQIRTTAQECEIRVLDAKAEAERRLRVVNEQIDRRLQETRRSLEEISEKRIAVLEQLAEVHSSLESIPAILQNAYHEVNVSPESGLVLTSRVDDQLNYSHTSAQEDELIVRFEDDETEADTV